MYKLPEYVLDLLALQYFDGPLLTADGLSCSCVGVWMNDRVEIIGKSQPPANDLPVKFGNSQVIQRTSRIIFSVRPLTCVCLLCSQ